MKVLYSLLSAQFLKAVCVWFQSLFHKESPLPIEMKVLYSLLSAHFLKAVCVWFQSLFHEESPLPIEMKVLYSLPSTYVLYDVDLRASLYHHIDF